MAWSTPLRSSPIRVQLLVEKTRRSVPVSLAVASISPSGLRSNARSGEPWAGIMLTLPVLISTICTCPGVRPGKTKTFEPRQQRPRGLSAVSKTDIFSGGDEKAYMWTVLKRATTMRVRESLTCWTVERNSSVITAFCFASSHMITYNIHQPSNRLNGGVLVAYRPCSVGIWAVCLLLPALCSLPARASLQH